MKKILIVEDDTILLSTLADNLSHAGFKIMKASDGEKGLEMALNDNPDLILLDILLPKMDGITFLQKFWRNNEYLKIPIIILTNLSDAESVSHATATGAYTYLVKTDWKIEDVVAKVREKLKE